MRLPWELFSGSGRVQVFLVNRRSSQINIILNLAIGYSGKRSRAEMIEIFSCNITRPSTAYFTAGIS